MLTFRQPHMFISLISISVKVILATYWNDHKLSYIYSRMCIFSSIDGFHDLFYGGSWFCHVSLIGMHFTLKINPLRREDLDEFVKCYNVENRHSHRVT